MNRRDKWRQILGILSSINQEQWTLLVTYCNLLLKILYQMLSILSEFLESFQFTWFLFMMLLPHNSDSFSYYFLNISEQLYFWFAASVFIDLRQSHASLWSSRIGKQYKVISSDIYRQQGFNHKYFDKSFSILFNCAIIYCDLLSLQSYFPLKVLT